jgi:hypothetical protein
VWWGSSIIGKGGKIIPEDHEFIVTRATIAIVLHLLRTFHPAAPQSVWVLTTHTTYSTEYRRSSYAPGLSDKDRKTKANKQTLTTYKKQHRTQEVNYQKKRREPSKHKDPMHLTISTGLHPAGCQHDTNLCRRITTPRVRRAC